MKGRRLDGGVGRRLLLAPGFLSDRRDSRENDFSFIAPFLLLIVGVTCAGLYFGMKSSVALVASDAARYAVSGESRAERLALAKTWVSDTNNRYALLNHKGLSVTTTETGSTLVVSVRYDASALLVVPVVVSTLSLSPTIEQSTTVFLR